MKVWILAWIRLCPVLVQDPRSLVGHLELALSGFALPLASRRLSEPHLAPS